MANRVRKQMSKGGRVTTDELITMKALQLAGKTNEEIGLEMQRDRHTVALRLSEFEMLLPEYPGYRDKIKSAVKELAEEASFKMKYVADLALIQVVKMLPEASARDAAIVMKILHETAGSINPDVLLGEAAKGGANMERVQLILQQIINTNTTNNYVKNESRGVVEDQVVAGGGPEIVIEGDVQKGSVLPS